MIFTEDYYFQEKFGHLTMANELVKTVVFEECEFTTSSFTDCKFQKCKFLNCIFTDCILSAVIPMDSRFNEVNFIKCKAVGIDWTKAEQVRDINFTESQVNYSSFKLLKVSKIKMVKCEAREVDFTETDLSRGDFRNTDFEKSQFLKTNLSYADFSGAKNYDIDARNNTIKQTHFSLPEALSLLNSLDIILD
jgi:fluoroquinolone resistance protein